MVTSPGVRIVLCRPSHPGNIGAAARAMKTMGLGHLHLVRPRDFPSEEADARAAGADDVLARARLAPDLVSATAGFALMLGTSARRRGVALPEHSPREAARLLLEGARTGDVAIVFGAERTGLTNDELARCQGAVRIPTDATFSSLNLAAAVQVLCYELRVAAEAADVDASPVPSRPAPDDQPATVAEMEGLFGHLERALGTIDFFKGRSPVTIMRRLRRLYLRATPTRREVLILRGILSDAERSARIAGR